MTKRLKNVNYIDIEIIKKIDPDLFTFININSQDDFKKTERLME